MSTTAILLVAAAGMALGLYLLLRPRKMTIGGCEVDRHGDYQTEAAKVRNHLAKKHAEQRLRARFGSAKVDEALDDLRKKGYPI